MIAVAGAVAAAVVKPARVTRVVLVLVVLLAVLDLFAWGAFVADVNEAGSFFDCGVDCNATQYAVGMALFYAPVLMAAAVLVAGVYAAVTGRSARRAR